MKAVFRTRLGCVPRMELPSGTLLLAASPAGLAGRSYVRAGPNIKLKSRSDRPVTP
jgi:hypothetical protein